MKKILFMLQLWLSGCTGGSAFAQMVISDQSIRYQQERMVFKQWDKNKFTPKPGFLYTNPYYWMTWAWYPGYQNNDLRPLGPAGPQTQRLAFVAAMQNTDNAYKLHADTLRNTALSEAVNYSGELSAADPLWLLYYRHAFGPLLSQDDAALLDGTDPQVKAYLVRAGILSWYLEESHALAQRLEAARTTTLDRGSRILAYHRMLAEYRQLSAAWDSKKQRAKLYLSLTESNGKVKAGQQAIAPKPARTDIQIADDVLLKSKL